MQIDELIEQAAKCKVTCHTNCPRFKPRIMSWEVDQFQTFEQYSFGIKPICYRLAATVFDRWSGPQYPFIDKSIAVNDIAINLIAYLTEAMRYHQFIDLEPVEPYWVWKKIITYASASLCCSELTKIFLFDVDQWSNLLGFVAPLRKVVKDLMLSEQEGGKYHIEQSELKQMPLGKLATLSSMATALLVADCVVVLGSGELAQDEELLAVKRLIPAVNTKLESGGKVVFSCASTGPMKDFRNRTMILGPIVKYDKYKWNRYASKLEARGWDLFLGKGNA
jgi:hypothetical protein